MEFPVFYYHIISFLTLVLIITFLVIFISSRLTSKYLVWLLRKVGIILIVLVVITLIFICIWELFAYTFDIKQRFWAAKYTYDHLYNETLELYRLLYELKFLSALDQEIRLDLMEDLKHALMNGNFDGYKQAVYDTLMFLAKHHQILRLANPEDIINFVDNLDRYDYDYFSDLYYYSAFAVDIHGKSLID